MKEPIKNRQVVVITTRRDAHIPFVESHLFQPFFVIDPRELLEQKELSFRFNKQDKELQVTFGDMVLDNVVGVWYRKPQPVIRRELPVKDDYKLYSQNAMERLSLQLLSAFPNATWISPYYSIMRANNKTLQLVEARACGFNVPDTLVTSNEAAARAFLNTHPRCISKPLTIAYPKVNGEQKVLLTTIIEKDSVPNLQNLYLAPSIFQEAIDYVDDVRVIVIGDQAFGAIIRTPEEGEASPEHLKHVRDNRLGHYEGSIQIEAIHDLPADIAEKCIKHTKRLGLNFGAIDLLIDKKGVWWFLENNPNGQWAYIEDATKQPMGKAIADLLTKGL